MSKRDINFKEFAMKRLLLFSPLILAIPLGLLSAEIIIHAKTLVFWKMR